MAESSAPSAAETLAAARTPLPIGLGPEALWLLLALARHERRQEWVGWLAEHRLGGKPGLACLYPEPSSGEVPGAPGWTFSYHGSGCCVTQSDGTVLDVDFADDGSALEIDPYFYAHYLRTEPRPGWCERRLRAPEGCEEAWMHDLDELERRGLIERRWRFRLTETGQFMAQTLAPLLEVLEKESAERRAWLLARLGDLAGAAELSAGEDLRQAAEAQREARIAALRAALAQAADASAGSWALAALGCFGHAVAHESVAEVLAARPAGPLQHAALKILQSWPGGQVRAALSRAFEVHAAVPWPQRWRSFFGRAGAESDRPRRSLVLDLAEALLHRFRPEDLPPRLRSQLLAALAGAFRSREAEAAALLWLLGAPGARVALVAATRSDVPCSRRESACLLGLIGDDGAVTELLRLAAGPPESGHEAACVLSLLPAPHLRQAAAEWLRRNDGFEEAEGREIEVAGQPLRTWTSEEIARLHQREWVGHTMWQLRARFAPLFRTWCGIELATPG